MFSRAPRIAVERELPEVPEVPQVSGVPQAELQVLEEPQAPKSGPAGEGHGDSGTGLAFEEEGHGLDSVGIEELNADVDRLLQSIGLQNPGIDSELPQAVPKTSNSDPLAGPQPASSWRRGQYPLHRTSPLCQQADKRRKNKE